MRITNFGGNVTFQSQHYYEPRTEEEVLEILNMHKTGTIRVAASAHGWSEAIVSEDVLLNMCHLNNVQIEEDEEGGVWATVEAGCRLQRMLDIIHERTECTIPTIGGIKKQTISGAISTGTHGTGKSSLSHYMEEIRLAAYDEQGNAAIYTYTGGEELKAARCAVGCMGIILSVKFRCVPQYWIRENIVWHKTLESVLESEQQYPMQQFALFPYGWDYFVYQWELITNAREGKPTFKSYVHRWIDFLGVDLLAHAVLKIVLFFASSKEGSSRFIRRFYARVMPKVMAHHRNVADESERMLTLAHYLYRHLEMEVFVPQSSLKEAVETIQALTDWFGGNARELPEGVKEQLREIELLPQIEERRGFYTHHYPFFFRRILPDETLISMTADAKEPYYSISFFTYQAHRHRDHFYEYARYMASILARLYSARVHWGKYFPLSYQDIAHLYPSLKEFRELCRRNDPKGVFQNEFTRRALGFYW